MDKPVAAVRPATIDDLRAYFGDEYFPTFKAIVGTLDGRIVAAAGLAFKDGAVGAFCNIDAEARPYKHHIHRTALKIIREAKQKHKYIYAEVDRNEPGAEKWLTRLGFKHVNGNVYRLG